MSESLTRQERDQLVKRFLALRLEKNSPAVEDAAYEKLYPALCEAYNQVLGEYGDRLPRMILGMCPFSKKPLKRSFDPFGLDGPWWWEAGICVKHEPPAPPAFRVLLGALSLQGRVPAEATKPIIPGPDVPFVIPRLLKLPGMVAVIHRMRLETGDITYPISYWSETEIPTACLHQSWLERELWSDGGWTICSDAMDFALDPWIAEGKVMWTEGSADKLQLRGHNDGITCLYSNLPSTHESQYITDGELITSDPPDGTLIDPYVE